MPAISSSVPPEGPKDEQVVLGLGQDDPLAAACSDEGADGERGGP